MPYINKLNRERILIDVDPDVFQEKVIDPSEIQTAGEMQFAMAVIVNSFVKRKGKSYQTFNDVMGSLAGQQMEVYRRLVADLEDIKIKENGDIYD